MTITRQHLAVALVCGSTGAVVGMAGGVLAGRDLPDVLVAGAALLLLAVWSAAAGYLGWAAAMHNIAERLDQLVQIALDLQREALADDDALALYRSLYEPEPQEVTE